MRTNKMANVLGWVSVGLGALEVAAPRRLGAITGIGDHPWITRAFGVREIVAGVGLLTQSSKAPWIRFRLAGDAIDVAAMSLAAVRSDESRPSRIAVAAAAVAPIVIMDVLCARNLRNTRLNAA